MPSDSVFERAIATGADITSPIAGQPWGERSAERCADRRLAESAEYDTESAAVAT